MSVCCSCTASPVRPESLRRWAEHLVEAGFSVRAAAAARSRHQLAGREPHHLRRLAGRGHRGAGRPAASRCRSVVVGGLSMGGTLTLRLAELHPDAIAGIVLVNPSVLTRRKDAPLAGVIKYVVPSFPRHRRRHRQARRRARSATPGSRCAPSTRCAAPGRWSARPAEGDRADPAAALAGRPCRRTGELRGGAGRDLVDRRDRGRVGEELPRGDARLRRRADPGRVRALHPSG